MEVYKNTSRIIVTCNKRLAPYLETEIRELGFEPERVFSTGVELNGTMLDCIKLNLNLRCASQVLFSLKSFQANDPDEVYRALEEIRWEDIIDADGYFSVTNNASHPSIKNTMFANVKVKDAIVDRFRSVKGRRPDSGPSLEKAVIHLYWRDTDAEIFVDTSGETLAKHGYRVIPGKAPMLEALATGTLMAGKWNRTSPFVNPMCGSATLAIEAAMLATKRVPGLYRENYAFMHLKGFDKQMYKDELKNIRSQIINAPPSLRIIATDIRQDAIDISKVNAEQAGVDALIDFAVCDFEKTHVPENFGVVFFNPEYGQRLGDIAELEHTYERIGDFLKKKCQGYTGYVFTGNLDLAKKIGLKASRRIEFYNAKIDCRLLEYELYAGTRRTDVKQTE